MKSDLQYSVQIVYNNFPWPSPNAKQRSAIESAADDVTAARESQAPCPLEDLYDPVTMRRALVGRQYPGLDHGARFAIGA